MDLLERIRHLENEVERLSREQKTVSHARSGRFGSIVKWIALATLIAFAIITGASELGKSLDRQFETLSTSLDNN